MYIGLMKGKNMSRYVKITVTTLFLLLVCNNSHGKELSFSSAVELLYNNNENIQIAEENINKHKYELYAARGLFSPIISLNAGYIHFNEDLTIDVDLSPVKSAFSPLANTAFSPLLAGFPSSMTQVLQDKDTFLFGASAVWNIFTGGQIYSANKAAKYKKELASQQYYGTKSKLTSQLASLYFSVRLSENIVAVKKEVYDTMQDHYNKAVKMEKAGVLAKVERMHAEVALSNAKRDYNKAIRESELSKAALKSILNIDTNITTTTPLFIIDEEFIEQLSFFQEEAMQNNSNIKQLEIGSNLAKVGVTNSRSAFYPKVFLFSNANIYGYNKSNLLPDWTVGVGVTFNIFDGLKGYNKVRSAKTTKKITDYQKSRAEKDIKTLIEQQYITLQNAREDYNAVKATITFTQEYLKARKKAFSQGMATSLDVVDAELSLSGAKIEALIASYKFDVALAQLLDTAGLYGLFENYRMKASVEFGL